MQARIEGCHRGLAEERWLRVRGGERKQRVGAPVAHRVHCCRLSHNAAHGVPDQNHRLKEEEDQTMSKR
jgi:hypothetical protein